ARAMDPGRVIGCVVYPATSLVSPGVIRHVEGERFSIGELDGSHSPRCLELSRILGSGGLKAPVQPRIRAELWLKLLGNAVFNPLSALTRASLGDIAQSPLVADVVPSPMQEADAVARPLGGKVPVSADQPIKGDACVG